MVTLAGARHIETAGPNRKHNRDWDDGSDDDAADPAVSTIAG